MSKETEPKNDDDATLADWGDYMDAKKSKLQEQFLSQAKNVEIKKDIFQGTSIFVNGYTVPTADELRLLMMHYGGIYHHYYSNGKTNFMIATNLPSVKIKQYKNSSAKIIKPSWVTDSIKAGKMLDFRKFLLLSDFAKGENRISFKRKSEEMSEEVATVTNETETMSKSDLSSTSKPMNYSSRKTASDEHFLEEFYNNSRLHHISTMGATFKQYVNELRSKNVTEFLGRDRLKKWKQENSHSEKSSIDFGPCIMHIDMDCFFVSVGIREYPQYKGLAIAVTHAKGNKAITNNSDSRKAEFELHSKRNKEKYENTDYKPWYVDISENDSMAEIASCSYEARKLGIKNGMLLGQALKLCPDLKTIPYNFEGYKEVSYALYNHIASYTLDIEAVSCDEMYVDCTTVLTTVGVCAMEFASFIRKEIKDLTRCPCSTGFGSNRLLARLATKKAKPDGQYLVEMSDSNDFIKNFDVSDLPGVGHSIARKLNNMGTKTCKDLQNIPLSQLQQEFGMKVGLTLHKQSFGEDERALNFCHKRKSVSAEVNYGIRFQSSLEAEKFIQKLSAEVESRLNAIGSRGKSITLKLMLKHEDAPIETAKYLGHGICNYITKTVTLLEATSEVVVIYREVMKIIQNMNVNPADMRGIGIQVTRLEDKKNINTSSGRIDKFVIKSKREINTEPIQNVQESSRDSAKEVGDQNKRTFDESEYDISFSQVDPDYLSALPSRIREKLITELKKKSRYSSDINSSFGDESPSSFIIKENGSLKLNPLIPATEIVKGIAAWISNDEIPQFCDVKILSDYLRQLILVQRFECVNFIIDNFQRSIYNCKHPDNWKKAFDNINEIVREAMKLKC